MNKKKLFMFLSALLLVLSVVVAALVVFVSSPLHPKNITDKTVVEKGAEYTVRINGVSDYDERGFMPVTKGFYFTGEKVFVYKDEEGFACTAYDGNGECYLLGKYNTAFIDYESYSFCGGKYKSIDELEAFFDEPERIYNFDIDKLSEYIQDIIQYKRHFYGTLTVKIYRGRCVITEFYIDGEKILEYKK